ncbi:MAG: PIG-L family deacetylase [Peptostreptococcaceae bacterium]|nr:PIG-L family deacetylase [Peptostreptococcaceae bacterium]
MDYKKIMAVGGHIGDMELTAGGVLATCAAQGGEIMTVALTAGERGCPPTMSETEYRKQKINEAEIFAGMMNGRAVVFDTPDGELEKTEENVLHLARLIREFKPELIITHWSSSLHKDHINCHHITKDASFFAGLAPYKMDDLPSHNADDLWYAENWEDPTGFVPYIYTDVTLGYEVWRKAIEKHWFVTGSKDFPYLRYYDHLQVVRGCLIRKDRAQAFAIDEMKKIKYV